MVSIQLKKLLKKNKCLFLAYDQGLEHGPTDFNDDNVNPKYIIDIARKAKVNAIVFQKGIAEKYKKEIKKSRIPLIVKLNGKTSLVDGEPYSTQLCTVKEARALGAVAVGYTIYIGSEYERLMFAEFEKIEQEAHAIGMPVVAWIYPRGASLANKPKGELLAYAARVGLEIGADIIKLHSECTKEELAWAVKSAGRARVVLAGGSMTDDEDMLAKVKEAMGVGVTGLAVGRNIWQSQDPVKRTKALQKVIWKK